MIRELNHKKIIFLINGSNNVIFNAYNYFFFPCMFWQGGHRLFYWHYFSWGKVLPYTHFQDSNTLLEQINVYFIYLCPFTTEDA